MPEPLTVLLVESQAKADWSLAELVAAQGYHVQRAAAPEAAIAILSSGAADILIASGDLSSPALAMLLRQAGELAIPVLVTTPADSLDAVTAAIRQGAYDCLPVLAHGAVPPEILRGALRRAEASVMRRRAESETNLHSRELAALYRATNAITLSLDPSQVLTTILVEIQQLLHVDGASVLLLDPKSGELAFRATSKAFELCSLTIPPDQGMANWALKHNCSLLVNDVSQDPRFYPGIDQLTGYTTRSLMAVPLRVLGKTIGVLEVVNRVDGDFTERDLSLFESLALPAAAAIRNSMLYQDLLHNHGLLQVVLDSVADGIVVVDPEGAILLHNPAADRIFGMPLSRARGANIRDVLAPYLRRVKVLSPKGASIEDYVDAITSRSDDERFTLEVSNGELRILDAFVTSIQYAEEEGSARLLVWHDITQEKEVERWREELGHIIVHDLRNPLSLARVGVEATQMFLPPDSGEDVLQGLALALQGIAQLERRTDILLAVNRLEADRQMLNVAAVQLADLVERAADFSSFEAQERQVHVVVDLMEQLPVIYGDEEVLEWVLGELLQNAIRNSPGDGTVRILASADADAVVLTIEDQGAPIPEGQRARLFEKFLRTQAYDGRRGAGIRLYFCRLAIEAHGGQIGVECEPEQGCRFVIHLPITPPRHGLTTRATGSNMV